MSQNKQVVVCWVGSEGIRLSPAGGTSWRGSGVSCTGSGVCVCVCAVGNAQVAMRDM